MWRRRRLTRAASLPRIRRRPIAGLTIVLQPAASGPPAPTGATGGAGRGRRPMTTAPPGPAGAPPEAETPGDPAPRRHGTSGHRLR